jgi:hypothetical protein
VDHGKINPAGDDFARPQCVSTGGTADDLLG